MELRKRYRRCLVALLCFGVLGLGLLGYEEIKSRIPDSYIQTEGEEIPKFPNFFVTETILPKAAEASANAFYSESYTISYKYLGLFPLKESQVHVEEPLYLLPGGIPIGIYMETEGVLIVGTGKVADTEGLNREPAYGIVQAGDYIRFVDGKKISRKEELMESVKKSKGRDLILGLERKGENIQVRVSPVKTGAEEYKLGVWVRDNTQGIGTLTFLTKEGEFGALGHGISDVDTGTMMKLSEGKLYDTNIVEIKKGEKGSPGELSGTIRYQDSFICGEILENTAVGIFGIGRERLLEKLQKEPLQVGYRQEVELGEAFIRSSVDGGVRDYRVEITEVHRKEEDINKGIILRVTDPELLELTGGIVQGMSGSPILQNGKIIGAVTHVFVQDSTKGYGIFIENMLEKEKK